MAMINVIITNGLYDHDFVEKWTYGVGRAHAFMCLQGIAGELEAELLYVGICYVPPSARGVL